MEDNSEQVQASNEPATSTETKSLNIGGIFKENRKSILLVSGVLTGVLLLFTVVYFAFFYQSSLDEYADQFCSCSEASESAFYNYSKDGFGYRSDMEGCFAEDFKNYSEYFSKMEKQRLVKVFQEKVIAKCPQKLSLIFEYK